jgi:septal ring-binding cell division protein DamX
MAKQSYKPNWERVTDALGITGSDPGVTDDYQAKQPTPAPASGSSNPVRVRRIGTRSFPVETTDTNPISSAPARARNPTVAAPAVAAPASKGRKRTVEGPKTTAGPKTVTTVSKASTIGYPSAPSGSSVADDRSGYTTSRSYGRQAGMGNSSAKGKSKPNLSHQGGSHDFSALKFFRGD